MENLSHKMTNANIITVIRTDNQTSAFSGTLPTGPHFAGSLGFGAGEQGAGLVTALPLETAKPKHLRLLFCL